MPIIVTPASLIRDVRNDYSAAEQQFEKHGVPFVDFSDDQVEKAGRERADTAHKALLNRLLYVDDYVPRLAIVMNVKGRPRAFPDALQSVGQQTYLRFRPDRVELILVQDGPNGVLDDIVLADIRNALAGFPSLKRIQAYRVRGNDDSIGRGTARNVGIWNADREQTQVIMFLDDALILDPDFIAEQMVRHNFVTTPIALLGFKENRRYKTVEEYSRKRHKLQSERPNFREDLKYKHKFSSDETIIEQGTSGFDYEGQHFDIGSNINYMKLTSNFKALDGSKPIGHRVLPMFFHTGLTSVTYSCVLEVGGFEKAFDVGLWSMEDSYLGLLLAVKGVKLVPCPSSVAFKVEIDAEEEHINKPLHLEFNRETFWDCASKKPWASYNKSKLEQAIERLRRLNLIEQIRIPIVSNPTEKDNQSRLRAATVGPQDPEDAHALANLESRLQFHNLNILSGIGFKANSAFVPVRSVYVERTQAQSMINTKLGQALAEPDSSQIIAVTGLAGSGKTSLLDDLSRRASAKGITPVFVMSEGLTDSGSESRYFNIRFKDYLSDNNEPAAWQVLRNISDRFSHARRPLLIMIDTVDYLVVQESFSWRSFYSLLLELASLPCVIVCITCRPDEFDQIKTDQFFPVPLGNLTDEEISIALNNYTDCFYKKADSETQKTRLRHRADTDDKFRRLVADPLKLRMLFEAYSGREIYEEEISTAKLYDRFWRVKIWSESRRQVKSHDALSPIPAAKDSICTTVAFGLLVDKGLEFEEPSPVKSGSSSIYGRAWSELRSDAVIHQPVESVRKYRFFHETFFEYAAARHIATSDNSAMAAKWLIRHFAENGDFFVAPIISHLATLHTGLALKIVQGLYASKTDTTELLFTKRLAAEIFSNVDEPERSAVGAYLLSASLKEQDQITLESLIQRAGHLPANGVGFALTLFDGVWRAQRTHRIHLLVLRALADLSKVDPISVWKWIENNRSDVLTFDETNREGFGTRISVALEIFRNCYQYSPELITKTILAWYEVAGEISRSSIISLLLSYYGTSSERIWRVVIDKFKDATRPDWGIKIARAIGETLAKLPKDDVANVVPAFLKMLEEKNEISRRSAVVLGTLAANPGHEKLFRNLWKKFLAEDEHTGNLFIVFSQMAKDGYLPLVKRLKKASIRDNSQLLDLLTECPVCAPLPLTIIEHLAENTKTRMKMALARALVKSAAFFPDAHAFLRDLIGTRWAGRERAYAIGALKELNHPQPEDVSLLMRLYPTFDAKAKLSCGKTIARWFRIIKNDPNFLALGSEAIHILIEDESTTVKETAVEALTMGTELIPIFSESILKASSSSATGVRLKSVQLLRASGNDRRLITMAKSDPDENIRREALLEIARSFSGEQLIACFSSAADAITSEKSTAVLRAWCFAASSAARISPQTSGDAIKAVIRRAAQLRLSKEAEKDIGKNAAHTIHLLVQTDRENPSIFFEIVQTAKEALSVFPGTQHLVIGVIEGLTRAVSINDERLRSILMDSAIPEACKEPIYNKQKEMRRTSQARLTELERIAAG